MSVELKEVLKTKAINKWMLFSLIAGPISIAVIIAMMRTDLSSAPGVSSMIQLSVRCAIPSLYLAFAASSIRALFPGPLSLWLLRNRKIFGLCFAAAMAWQAQFIVWLVTVHHDYYMEDVYVLRDVIEGILGYFFLVAMTLTSFKFGSSRLTPVLWMRLHTGGIYWQWYYAWSVYWFNLFYYDGPALFIDYVYYWGGLLAWGLRLSAWTKKRSKQSAEQTDTGGVPRLLLTVLGISVVLVGLAGSGFGSAWSPQTYDFLYGIKVIAAIEPFTPYSPGVPFYPMFIMMLGALLMVKSKS